MGYTDEMTKALAERDEILKKAEESGYMGEYAYMYWLGAAGFERELTLLSEDKNLSGLAYDAGRKSALH